MEIQRNRSNSNIKRLCLGTAQFGLEYGINNTSGKPNHADVMKMLEYAFDKGISYYDTAGVYGNSEVLIGDFVKAHGLQNQINIISKFYSKEYDARGRDTKSILLSSIEESLGRLSMESLEGYLLHDPKAIYDDEILEGLVQARKDGMIKNVGVSVYELADAQYAMNTNLIDAIQIPYNILDQRIEALEFSKLCESKNITVFTRSASLQGLLLMEEIPTYLEHSQKYIKEIQRLIKKYDEEKLNVILHFVLSNPMVSYLVFGVDDIDQLKQNIQLVEDMKINQSSIKALRGKYTNVDKSIIFPSLWKRS